MHKLYTVTCGPSLGNELANTLLRRDCFLETSWIRNTVSRDTETESCTHLENETIAWDLIHDSPDNTTEQRTVRHGDFYPGSVAVIKGVDSCCGGGIGGLPCEGGVEYLHRSPASRRTRRKEKSRIGDSKIWPRVPWDSDPRMTALKRARNSCKRQTRPLVRESAPLEQTRNCLAVTKIWSYAPEGCFIPRQTGRLTVGRNIRLRLRLRLEVGHNRLYWAWTDRGLVYILYTFINMFNM
jgi:hypothetical protein